MKNVFIIIIFCFTASMANARDCDSIAGAKDLSTLQIQIDKVEREILDNKLNINRLIYEEYLAKAESTKRSIPIFALKTFNNEAIYDTVPELRKLNDNFEKENDALIVILNADRELQKEGNSARKKRRKSTNLVEESKYAQYSRLHKTCPDYRKARKKREEALSIQNIALARFILSHCHENREVMPTEGVISNLELEHITDSEKITNLILDGAYLQQLRSKLRVKHLDAQFNPDGL